jgi:hypothetical protein
MVDSLCIINLNIVQCVCGVCLIQMLLWLLIYTCFWTIGCYYKDTFFIVSYFKISHDDVVVSILAKYLVGPRSISIITTSCKIKVQQIMYQYNNEQCPEDWSRTNS